MRRRRTAQGSLEELTVVDYILADPLLKDLARAEVEGALDVVGFTDAMKKGSITSLSGGAWRAAGAVCKA